MADPITYPRRQVLRTTLGALAMVLLPVPLAAAPAALQRRVGDNFPGRQINNGRVTLTLPALSENGNSVALEVEVDSAMTATDRVQRITLFSDKNPLPDVARFHFGPSAGRAAVATRIRLADSQIVTAVAEFQDGSLWSGTAEVIVTLAACINLD